MWRRLCILVVVALAASASAQTAFPPPTRADRIVIVAPHPDDDVLGAGGLIQQAVVAGADVRVVYLTNGDHNQIAFKVVKLTLHLNARHYLIFGERRRQEAIASAGQLGLTAGQLTFLGYPDWGTLRIWRDYWDAPKPFRSDATRVSAVPYQEALSPGKPYRPESIVEDLCALFRQLKPTRILVTHPADTNPDHRAAANFVRLAALELAEQGMTPAISYYIVHFGGWPRPYHYHPELELDRPRGLLDDGDWSSVKLTPGQRHQKCLAILEHRTQIATRHYFLVSFARANEIFAVQPTPRVPCLPAGVELDWRKAVRNKVLECPSDVPTAKMDGDSDPEELPPETIMLEKTEFLRQGDDLYAAIKFKSLLGRRSGVHLMLYGYQRGRPFSELPKVRIHLTPLGKLQVYRGRTRVERSGVTVTSIGTRSIVRVPLVLLGGGDIEYLFTAMRAHLGEISANDTAWQLLALQSNPQRKNVNARND